MLIRRVVKISDRPTGLSINPPDIPPLPSQSIGQMEDLNHFLEEGWTVVSATPFPYEGGVYCAHLLYKPDGPWSNPFPVVNDLR